MAKRRRKTPATTTKKEVNERNTAAEKNAAKTPEVIAKRSSQSSPEVIPKKSLKTTPVRRTTYTSDIQLSQSSEPICDVGWQASSPITLTQAVNLSKEKDNGPDIAELVKKFSDEGGAALPSCTPPLLSLWQEGSPTFVHVGQPVQNLNRMGRRRRGRPSGIKATVNSKDILMKLAAIMEKPVEKPAETIEPAKEDDGAVEEKPKEDGTSRVDSEGSDKSFELFDATQKIAELDNLVHRLTPKTTPKRTKLNQSSDDLWTDEELFNDDSFILKATQDLFDVESFDSAKAGVTGKGTTGSPVGVAKSGRYTFSLHPGPVRTVEIGKPISTTGITSQAAGPRINQPKAGTSVTFSNKKQMVPVVHSSTLPPSKPGCTVSAAASLPVRSYYVRSNSLSNSRNHASLQNIIPPSQTSTGLYRPIVRPSGTGPKVTSMIRYPNSMTRTQGAQAQSVAQKKTNQSLVAPISRTSTMVTSVPKTTSTITSVPRTTSTITSVPRTTSTIMSVPRTTSTITSIHKTVTSVSGTVGTTVTSHPRTTATTVSKATFTSLSKPPATVGASVSKTASTSGCSKSAIPSSGTATSSQYTFKRVPQCQSGQSVRVAGSTVGPSVHGISRTNAGSVISTNNKGASLGSVQVQSVSTAPNPQGGATGTLHPQSKATGAPNTWGTTTGAADQSLSDLVEPELPDTSITDDILATLAEPDEILDSQMVSSQPPVDNIPETSCAKVEPHIPKASEADTTKNTIKHTAKGQLPVAKPVQQQTVVASASTVKQNTDIGAFDDEEDEDDALSEPQLLAILDEVEFRASQEMSKKTLENEAGVSETTAAGMGHSPSKPQNCEKDDLVKPSCINSVPINVLDEVDVPASQCGTDLPSPHGSQSSTGQCADSMPTSQRYSPEEIAHKRQEALKRRQNKLKLGLKRR